MNTADKTKFMVAVFIAWAIGYGMGVLPLAIPRRAELPEPPSQANPPLLGSLEESLAATLRTECEKRKSDIVKSAGGWFEQRAVAVAWPIGMRELPNFVRIGSDAVMERFGSMSLRDLHALLEEYASRKASHAASSGSRPNVAGATGDTPGVPLLNELSRVIEVQGDGS